MDRSKIALLALLLLAVSQMAYSACASYDQDCSSDACCNGLVCGVFVQEGLLVQKCTQQPSVCTNMPEHYVKPPDLLGGALSPGGPLNRTIELENGTGIVSGGTGIYRVGWFSDWSTAGLIGIAIVIAVIAIAAMAGHGFNMPEVKAFAKSELMQAVVSAILIAFLLVIVGGIDMVAREALEASDLPILCVSGEPCYMTAAKFYLQTLYDAANGYADGQLRESIRTQALASTGVSTQLNFWQLLYAGGSMRMNAGMSIQAERAAAIFDTAGRLMGSIYAQRYFIDVVAYGIAPVFLLLGILLRTFFFTRKLGGLLLAIAISLFVVYPLTYAFVWYTLNVTIYGERTLGSADPYCPSECTARYPVAYFVNVTTGELTQFETTQEIMRAGVNATNWASGNIDADPDVEFPGLVACRDLGAAGIPAYSVLVSGTGEASGDTLSVAGQTWTTDKFANNKLSVNNGSGLWLNYTIVSNTADTIKVTTTLPGASGGSTPTLQFMILGFPCSGCPDYCREVPFPSGLPGCNIDKCSTCNAGCKIMRQRTDCRGPNGLCPLSNCSMNCLTKLPVENKCYDANEGYGSRDVKPANLSATCGGCSTCPNWCRFLALAPSTGQYELVYKDEPACASCKAAFANSLLSPPVQPYCPAQCMYATDIGKSTKCDSLCSDGASGVICPLYCRTNVTFDNSWLSKYDMDPPNITQLCTGDSRILAACQNCPSECKLQIGEPDYNSCAPYPQNNYKAEFCADCPQYCRFPSFAFISSFSNTQKTGGVPDVCADGLGGRLNCADTGSPAACGAACKIADTPLTCRTYNGSDSNISACRRCPPEGRITLNYTQNGTGQLLYLGPVALTSQYKCSDPDCSPGCRMKVNIPNEQANPACKNESAVACPYACRITGLDPAMVNASCNVPACSSLPAACKANLAGKEGYTCSEFLGNGPFNTSVSECYGDAPCPTFTTNRSCRDNGCFWEKKGSLNVPIANRSMPYDDASLCRQCPENCRISGYEGDCGVTNNTGNAKVDCSALNCPGACRADFPPALTETGSGGMCKNFRPVGMPCEGCPALCRFPSDIQPPSCPSSQCGPYSGSLGCTDYCQLPKPTEKTCEGCFDCPLDCTYYPAVRTDCSEVCADEALAGPVNIAPDDFIKKLPGARGASDVKGVGMLMVPALVLPLFCIVIVIAFIRIFSPLLGGDMEIPGLGRII